MGQSHLQKHGASRLSRKSRKRSSGYRTLVDANGVIHVVPREVERLSLPVVPLVMLAALLLVFKALAMANVGLNDYLHKLSILEGGTFLERGAAYILHPDPATIWVYDAIRPLMV